MVTVGFSATTFDFRVSAGIVPLLPLVKSIVCLCLHRPEKRTGATRPPGSIPPGSVPPGTVPRARFYLEVFRLEASLLEGFLQTTCHPVLFLRARCPPAGVLSSPDRFGCSPVLPKRDPSVVPPGADCGSAGPAAQSVDINMTDNPNTRTSGVIRFVIARATSRERVVVSEWAAV